MPTRRQAFQQFRLQLRKEILLWQKVLLEKKERNGTIASM